MNSAHVPEDLQDILDAYMAAAEAPTHAVLQEWIARYPHYRQQLTDFTVSWGRLETIPPAGNPNIADEALVQHGLNVAASVFAADTEDAPLTSLVQAGQVRGLTPAQLAARCGFGVVLMRKLEQRLIRVASIPREAIAAIAGSIGYDPGAVTRYLQQPAAMATGTSYYARETPHVAEPEDFADAVRADPSMTPEQRRRWLDQS